MRRICFMVMPYGVKPTQAEAGKGPPEVDFNALWDRAFAPAIESLGYRAVRADQDVGALIVNEMLERLYFADLVLADMTIPNGNVYYEVGIRHAAKDKGCVLLAADWSRQLFDVAQMRTVRYPLPEGSVTDGSVAAIRAALTAAVPPLASGLSPMHQAVKGFPGAVDAAAASSMRDQMEALAEFQAAVRTIRALPAGDRLAAARALAAQHSQPSVLPLIAIAIVRLLAGAVERKDDWQHVLAYIAGLQQELATEPEVREQRALALSKGGDHLAALTELGALVATAGPTPERLGLTGGRHKSLMDAAKSEADRRRYLEQAIDSYERGMWMDLNEYYCSSNLPSLYRARGGRGDEERALAVLSIVIMACERAVKRGTADEWVRQTLLVAAFDRHDPDKADELADQVALEGAARWKLDSTLASLRRSVEHVHDPVLKARLAAVVVRLEQT